MLEVKLSKFDTRISAVLLLKKTLILLIVLLIRPGYRTKHLAAGDNKKNTNGFFNYRNYELQHTPSFRIIALSWWRPSTLQKSHKVDFFSELIAVDTKMSIPFKLPSFLLTQCSCNSGGGGDNFSAILYHVICFFTNAPN